MARDTECPYEARLVCATTLCPDGTKDLLNCIMNGMNLSAPADGEGVEDAGGDTEQQSTGAFLLLKPTHYFF